MKKMKRIVVISDTHSGHSCGLTSPDWQYKHIDNATTDFIRRRNKIAIIQKEMWNWYSSTLKKLQPIDTLFHLGDCIDGFGEKSGGTELITTDMLKQCEIACDCINEAKAKEKILVHGTGYHVGNDVDYEEIIAQNVGAKKIGSHEWVSVNGVIFDLKHKIGGSSSPYNRGASVSKDQLWNAIWAEKDLQPKSSILLRGHLHYDYFVGNSDFLGIINPGLQWSTVYGSRQCSAMVSIGLTVFDVYPDGSYNWHFEIAKLESQKAKAIELN